LAVSQAVVSIRVCTKLIKKPADKEKLNVITIEKNPGDLSDKYFYNSSL